MSDTNAVLIAGLFSLMGACLALLGVFSTLWFQQKKQKSEETRWYLDYFMPKQIESVSNVYAALVDFYHALDRYRSRLTAEKAMGEVWDKYIDFDKTLALASVYLRDDLYHFFKDELIVAFIQPIGYTLVSDSGTDERIRIDYTKELQDKHWYSIDSVYRKAVQSLRTLLNPTVLDSIHTQQSGMLVQPKR
jgi:hypothetical protein